MSGQGLYYGQLGWFKHQPESHPFVIKRYSDEIRRVTSVLDKALEDRLWLVGDKCTFADLSFVTWQDLLGFISPDQVEEFAREFSNVEAWMGRMKERADVKKVLDEKQQAMTKLHN